jgi:hypothetical protein
MPQRIGLYQPIIVDFQASLLGPPSFIASLAELLATSLETPCGT